MASAQDASDPPVDALVEALERAPLSRANTLIAGLGLGSQPTFSRVVGRAGDRVVAIGRARARRYAAARVVAGAGSRWPVYRVDAAGELHRLGTLAAIAPAGWALDAPAGLPLPLAGRRGDGCWPASLPPFVEALWPAGVHAGSHGPDGDRVGPSVGGEPEPGDEHLAAIVRFADDAPGDLVVGEEAARRAAARHLTDAPPIPESERPRAYPEYARAAGEVAAAAPGPGASRPEFSAAVDAGGSVRRVAVAFSPSEYSNAARRWCDLLVCEHLAARTLAAHGVPAADTAIVEGGSRVFLEVARFDRVGARGRRAVVTLATLLAEARPGLAIDRGWTAAARALRADRWIGADVLERVHLIETCARFLGDTGSDPFALSFVFDDDGTPALAPVRRLVPAAYAPAGEHLPPLRYQPPAPEPGHGPTWREAGAIARSTWRAIAGDDRVSASFRAIAGDNARTIDEALARDTRR